MRIHVILAAVITRLWFQRNLKGFGIRPGKPVWLVMGILLPIAAGLVMFGSAWISGIAPFNPDNALVIFSLSFIPAFLYAIAFNLFAAAGEEFGWRGFLVSELGRIRDAGRIRVVRCDLLCCSGSRLLALQKPAPEAARRGVVNGNFFSNG